MTRRRWRQGSWLGCWLCLVWLVASAQTQQPQQDIPDAPSATRPSQTFPSTPPPVAAQPLPGRDNPPENPPASDQPPPPPPPDIATVPASGETKEAGSPVDQVYTLKTNVNFVLVPVTVKDDGGHLVGGLLAKDFSVLEDGVPQRLSFFTSDPFPLSVAVIFDLGMSDAAVQKVNETFSALEGAFSPFDEVAIYTYSSTVSTASDFSAVNRRLEAVLNQLKTARGRNNGPPVTSGPLGPQGPVINGRSVDPSAPIVYTPPKESRVLNDAVLRAALDLSKRDRARRKMIFIISDGREQSSKASYSDVLKVLLSNEIQVYAVGVEGAAIPVYNKIQKLRLPRLGYSDILPKYASATGGEVFPEFSRSAIEESYHRAIGDTRNQYTLGYTTRATPSSAYRQIEVRVRAAQKVDVYAKDGYYPLPPRR